MITTEAGLKQRNTAKNISEVETPKQAYRAPDGVYKKNKDGKIEFIPPTFTISDVLGAIPKHCYKRSAFKSTMHVLVDLAFIFGIAFAASSFNQSVLSQLQGSNIFASLAYGLVKFAFWSAFCFVEGLWFTGVWVMAHEAGHGAYSESNTINDIAGFILHSALLVPYYSWKYSHSKHHKATGHMSRDQVFVPRLKSNVKPSRLAVKTDLDEILEDAPAYNLYRLLLQQIFGWPAYLFSNQSGQPWYPKFTNHFSPNSFIFERSQASHILASDIGLAAVIAILGFWIYKTSFMTFFTYYFVPYLWCNHWLVAITFLQHTDPMLPHYREGQWTFQRGAACTIDRKILGPVGPYIFHGIGETHVLHHFCSRIPHYNAWEASEAIQKVLGPYYLSSDENIFKSLWKIHKQCVYVEDEGEVIFYKDKFGESPIHLVM